MPRGRPRKVFSENPVKDTELHKPHACWDFTDYVVPLDDASAQERLDWWQSLDLKTLEIAREVCPTTHKLHGQGRIRFMRKYRFEQLKKIFPPDLHFEPSSCTIDDNYLRKHDSVTIVKIDNRKQGKRNVFQAQVISIKEGATLRDCLQMEGSNYQSIRSAELLMKYIEPERPCGPREVIEMTGSLVPAGVFRPANKRFEGYDAHEAVFLNLPLLGLTNAELFACTGSAPHRLAYGRQARFNTVYVAGLDEERRRDLRARYGSHFHSSR